jgi:hypothetical protein
MQHEPKTKRLPRYKRAPERFGRFEPTARDLEILRLVDDYRFLTSDHVFALVPGSKRQIARRLQGMYHHSFLSRLLPPLRMRDGIDDSPSGSPKFTYALDSEGAAAICHADKIPREELRWRAEHNGRMQWFIEHSLMVSTFRATMQLALAMRKDLNFVEWADEEELRDSVRVRYPNGRTELHRVAPDGYFAVRERGLHRNFFLEADRATEEHPRILAKFQSYWWYLSPGSATYHEKFENPASPGRLHVRKTNGSYEEDSGESWGFQTWSQPVLVYHGLKLSTRPPGHIACTNLARRTSHTGQRNREKAGPAEGPIRGSTKRGPLRRPRDP